MALYLPIIALSFFVNSSIASTLFVNSSTLAWSSEKKKPGNQTDRYELVITHFPPKIYKTQKWEAKSRKFI